MDYAELGLAKQSVREAMLRVARADSGKIYPLDLLAWAAANRTLGLCAGFEQLMKSQNYLSAAPLVRLQIDTFLRFKAAHHVRDPHDFATRVLRGERVDKLKDKSGKALHDRRLVDLSIEEAPWLDRVYRETSGFIHLSSKHIYGIVDGDLGDAGALPLKVSERDSRTITDDLRQEAIDAFVACVGLLVDYLLGWAATKELTARTEPNA